jgi:hypothetical protein
MLSIASACLAQGLASVAPAGCHLRLAYPLIQRTGAPHDRPNTSRSVEGGDGVTRISQTTLPDGSIKIKLDRSVTVLKNNAEADAFICGAKIAREILVKEIAAVLQIKEN